MRESVPVKCKQSLHGQLQLEQTVCSLLTIQHRNTAR
jgi:hypothetical protein